MDSQLMRKLIFLILAASPFIAGGALCYAQPSGPDSSQTAAYNAALKKAAYLKSVLKFDEAIELLSGLNEGPVFDERLQAELADCHFLNSDYASAIGAFRLLCAKRPENLAYRVRLMQLLFRMEDYAGACAEGGKILARDSIPAVSALVGDCFMKLRLPDSALVHYSNALRARPADPRLISKKAGILLDRKLYKETLALVNPYMEAYPDDMTAGPVQGLALYLMEDYAKSREVFQHQEDIGNDSYGVHYYLGLSNQRLFEFRKALPQFEKAWQIDSSDASLALSLAEVLSKTGKNPLPWLAKAEALVAPDPAFISELYSQRGAYHLSWERFDKALEAYLKAYGSNPRSLSSIANIAYCYEMKKDWKSAALWYEKYLKAGKPGTKGYDFAVESLRYVRSQLFMEEPAGNDNK